MSAIVTGKFVRLALLLISATVASLPHFAISEEFDFLPENLRETLLDQNQYDVYRFSVKHSSFSDYAFKSRYIFLPKGKKAVSDTVKGFLNFPDETLIVKRFFYVPIGASCYSADGFLEAALIDQRLEEGASKQGCNLEVRILRKASEDWIPEVYRWSHTDRRYQAIAVGGFQRVRLHGESEVMQFSYSIPDLGECSQCHAGALGRSANMEIIGPSLAERIDWTNSDSGFVDVNVSEHPQRERLSRDELARDYLDINCAHCHNPTGLAASSSLYLGKDVLPTFLLGICKPVVASGVAYRGNRYDIVPGYPEESILLDRMLSLSAKEKMPELGRVLLDKYGVNIVAEWISRMTGGCAEGNG